MLRSNSTATDLVAQFSQADIFKPGNVLDDVLEIVDVGEVDFHGLVEVIYGLRQLLS